MFFFFSSTKYLHGFPDHLCHFFTLFICLFCNFPPWHSLSGYLLLSLSIVIALLPHQNFGCYFSVFTKCGVTQHRLYRVSLTLKLKLLLSSNLTKKTSVNLFYQSGRIRQQNFSQNLWKLILGKLISTKNNILKSSEYTQLKALVMLIMCKFEVYNLRYNAQVYFPWICFRGWESFINFSWTYFGYQILSNA